MEGAFPAFTCSTIMSIAPAFVGQVWMLHGMPDGSIGAAHEDRYTKYYPGVHGKLDQFIGTPFTSEEEND